MNNVVNIINRPKRTLIHRVRPFLRLLKAKGSFGTAVVCVLVHMENFLT